MIVAITDDDILEDTENFFGTLTTTDSSVTLTPDRAQVNIFEDPNDGESKLLNSCVFCVSIIHFLLIQQHLHV